MRGSGITPCLGFNGKKASWGNGLQKVIIQNLHGQTPRYQTVFVKFGWIKLLIYGPHASKLKTMHLLSINKRLKSFRLKRQEARSCSRKASYLLMNLFHTPLAFPSISIALTTLHKIVIGPSKKYLPWWLTIKLCPGNLYRKLQLYTGFS